MTPRDLRNIHTTGNSCRDALPCVNMALKLPWYFYLLMEKPLGRYFQVRPPYYQVAQCNQKTPIPVSSRWQVTSEKAKKGKASTLTTATTSVHLLTPVSTDLTVKLHLHYITFRFNQPNGKGWGARLVGLIKHLPHKVFLSWYHHWKGGQPALKRHLLPMK